MSVVTAYKTINEISMSADPAQTIRKMAGDLSGFEVFGDRVLIGIYVRPEKTKGGILRPDTNKEEDVYQGKVGLVLKWGPDAFVDEDGNKYEQVVKPGEWGVFFIGDGKQLQVNDMPCRLVKDANFVGKIKDPMMVL